MGGCKLNRFYFRGIRRFVIKTYSGNEYLELRSCHPSLRRLVSRKEACHPSIVMDEEGEGDCREALSPGQLDTQAGIPESTFLPIRGFQVDPSASSLISYPLGLPFRLPAFRSRTPGYSGSSQDDQTRPRPRLARVSAKVISLLSLMDAT
jgi:hypothetical protein